MHRGVGGGQWGGGVQASEEARPCRLYSRGWLGHTKEVTPRPQTQQETTESYMG